MNPRALLVLLALGSAQAQEDETARSALTERTGRTIVQLEVLVDGPPEMIGALSAEDFELNVGGKDIDDLAVDRFCEVVYDQREEEEDAPEADRPLATPPPPTYLFYFDQTMMTMPGRVRSLQIARRLIDDLFQQPARGMVVSSGKAVEIFAGPTADPDELKGGLERLRNDVGQWDTFAAGEPTRIEEVANAFASGGCPFAEPLANAHYKEEIQVARRAVERMAGVLGSLIEEPPPKIAIYFADTLRALAGKHYWDILPPTCEPPPDWDYYHLSTPLERLYAVATTAGVRLYPVRAQGLAYPAAQAYGAHHLRAAEGTLKGIGLETGGDAFLGATSPENMIRRLRQDLSCRYLLSFDPAGLPLDRKLAVYLDAVPEGVNARARPSLVIQSAQERRVARLTAAFLTGLSTDLPEVRIETMPLGFAEDSKKTRMKTIVQVKLPAPEIAISAWEVGLSVVRKSRVAHEVSGRLEGVPTGAPMVVETMVELAGGSHEIVGVARETLTDRVLSSRTEEDVVVAFDEPLTLFPLEIYQETTGVFWRDGRVRDRGRVLLGSGATAQADRPLTVAGLVCREGKKGAGVFVARRTARGPRGVRYPREIPLDLTRERCVLVQDAFPAAWVGAGDYSFDLEIIDGERVLTSRTTTFRVEDL